MFLGANCKHLIVSVIRENTMMHIHNNTGFWHAIQLRYSEGGRDYADFESVWLRACTDEVRRMFDIGMPFDKISAAVKVSQMRSKPFVYRRTRTDVLKEIWNRLRDVFADRFVNSYMEDDRFEDDNYMGPPRHSLERDSLRELFYLINSTDPHSDSFNYGELLLYLGLDAPSVEAIGQLEAEFLATGSSESAPQLLAKLDDAQIIIAMAFFYILRAHVSVRSIPLGNRDKVLQSIAVARRTGVESGGNLPIGAHQIYFCSVLGCHKCKTPTVQQFGMSRIGNSYVSYDIEQRRDVCRPPKTSKGGSSLAAGRQREKRAAAASAGPAEYDPDSPVKACADAKTISTARREFKAARKVLNEKINQLFGGRPFDRKVVLEHPKVKALIEKLKQAREEVSKAIRKEINQFSRTMFNLPCEDGVTTSHNLLGYVVERAVGKDKTESYTLCTSCGCVTVFKTSLIYMNGAFIINAYF